MSSGTLRVGVFGLRRGLNLAVQAEAAGMQVSAVCDQDTLRLQAAGHYLDAALYEDFEPFIEHEMDAVVLANFFDEHAPYAMRALEAGKHVLSETAACRSIGEGVALIRAVERSGLVHMFGETFPYLPHALEMRRLYRSGEVGSFLYGESEYIDPIDPAAFRSEDYAPAGHWRRRISWVAYSTHSIAPIMHITDTLPTRVTAGFIPRETDEEGRRAAARGAGSGAAMLIHMSNGGVLRSLQGSFPGRQFSWMRIHGTRGLIENLRQGDPTMLRLRKEPWTAEVGEELERVVSASPWPRSPVAPVAGYGVEEFPQYGETDYLLCREFERAIRSGEPPSLDVYRGVAATAVGVCAFHSAIRGSAPVEVPDLRNEDARDPYESDERSWLIS